MFSFFKKKSPKERLEKQYRALLTRAHELSSVDRKQSDAKMAEAEEIWKQIEALTTK